MKANLVNCPGNKFCRLALCPTGCLPAPLLSQLLSKLLVVGWLAVRPPRACRTCWICCHCWHCPVLLQDSQGAAFRPGELFAARHQQNQARIVDCFQAVGQSHFQPSFRACVPWSGVLPLLCIRLVIHRSALAQSSHLWWYEFLPQLLSFLHLLLSCLPCSLGC